MRKKPSSQIRGNNPVAFEALERRTLCSTTFYVSPKGNDANPGTDPASPWRTVQHAFDAATPGSTVDVLKGTYHEKPTVNVSGNSVDGFITFQAVGKVTLDGTGIPGANIVFINNHSYIRIEGFNICNDLHVSDGSGIRVTSADDHIEILGNRIFNITGNRAMAITIYGTDPTNGISNITVSGNEAFNCKSFPGECITLNGNVHDFTVTNNFVHDITGIGIDCIGGEGMSPDPLTDMARNGIVSGNRVTRARSVAGGAHEAVGIMVDGAQNVVVSQNTCWKDQIGIEIGCVHPAATALNDVVRDNISYSNTEAGISVGGSDVMDGRVINCQVLNNTIYHNDTSHSDGGQLRIQWASNNLIENNLIVGASKAVLIDSEVGASNNTLNYNLLFSPAGIAHARFVWGGHPVSGLTSWLASSGGDANSVFAAPIFGPPPKGYLRLLPRSPGVNAGDPLFTAAAGETDFAGLSRVLSGRVDIGAYEVG